MTALMAVLLAQGCCADDPANKGLEGTMDGEMFTLRYAAESDEAVDALKAALKKLKGVGDIFMDPGNGFMLANYTGSVKSLAAVENLSVKGGSAVLISHVRMSTTVKAVKKGANLPQLRYDLAKSIGVKKAIVSGAGIDVYVDVSNFSPETLSQGAAGAGYEARVSSHDWVALKLSKGEPTPCLKPLQAVKGVMVARMKSDKAIEMWTTKKLPDDLIKKAVESAGAAIGDITRP